MLVSREIEFFRRAIRSILVSQNPDEILLFESEHLTWNLRNEIKELGIDAKIVSQTQAKIGVRFRIRAYYPMLDNSFLCQEWMHTYDLVVRSILEAENEWVRTCDDDDEMLYDISPHLDNIDSDVGVIIGDFVFHDEIKGHSEDRKGGAPLGRPFHPRGSTNCYRKSAVEEASKFWEPGPWPDWQLAYHMYRLGWKAKYIEELFSIQYWHGDNSSRARSGYLSWARLEKNLSDWWDQNKGEM
jgi:hypothetical protein